MDPLSPPPPAARLPTASMPVQTGRTISALVLREMGTTYGRSPGGYLWAVVEPVGMIAILSVAFSLVIRTPSLGTSFALFYATGFLPFMIYSDIASKVASTLKFSKALLSYPAVTWIDAVLARFILTFLTGTTVFSIVIIGVLVIISPHVILNLPAIITGLILAAAMGFGVGLLNCVLEDVFPIWKITWGIINRPLFLASGILFIYEDVPQSVQNIIWWNPIIHITGSVRTGFYSTYHANYISEMYVLGISLLFIAAGLLLLRSYHKLILEL